jgi:F-type H+-transporting ATPase subunit delta
MVTTFAKRCAQAIFELARENGKLEEWRSELKEIAQLATDPEIVSFIENTKISTELKMKLLRERLAKTSQLPLNLAYLLIAKGKFREFDQIIQAYEQLLNEQYGIKHAEVITATPLTETEKENIRQYLESVIGEKVVLTLEVNPEIIGGFIARVNSSLIDGSIRTRLQALRKNLIGAGR